MGNSNITMIVTSCNRHDLLKTTLLSFLNTTDILPQETIIIEDGDLAAPDWLRDAPFCNLNARWLSNGVRQGQIFSIDRAYREVKTDYIFHCEDDWKFLEWNFMRKSKAILDAHPEVLMVSLRGDTGWHPLVSDPRYPYKFAEPYWRGGWGGLAFNPGLRRLKDYQRIGSSYGRHVSYGTSGLGHEMMLSKMHLDMGYVIADLNFPYITHIGGTRSRAIEPLPKLHKILIAIPVCHKFDYTQWESSDSPLYDASKAWAGRPYGTDIHISGENNRIAALRDTWLKDIEPFKSHVDYRLFYGEPHSRPALADEVYLTCPDDYASLPLKTIEICKWAVDQGYDYIFKADDDSYVWVERLIAELLANRFEYAGHECAGVCTGGPGYWLSKRAMQIVARYHPKHWAEDVSVYQALYDAGLRAFNLPDHHAGGPSHWFDIDKIPAGAACIHALQPATMRELYRREH